MDGKTFKTNREKLGLNQDSCAVIFGGYQAKISRWETGGSRVPKSAANLMRVLTGEASKESLLQDAQHGGIE